MEEYNRYRDEALREFAAAVFETYGVPGDDARIAATVLVEADLMGVDSHGIAHLATHGHYCPGIAKGIINPRPKIRVVRETDTTALLEGDGGMGIVAGPAAMDVAIAKAEKAGVGLVSVTNTRHVGMLGYYPLMAARRDMLGMAASDTPRLVVPAGGAKPMLGTNPMSFAAPCGSEPTFLLDIATSAVAGGKLEIALRSGKTIPLGWALDKDGRDTTNPDAMYTGGSLLPLGSTRELSFHKGYGLAVMVDILSGVLSGNGFAAGLSFTVGEMGAFFAAARIDAFRPVEEFKSMMDEMCRALTATPPAEGFERVLVPGEREYWTRLDRLENGIPLHPKVVEELEELGKQVGVATPW